MGIVVFFSMAMIGTNLELISRAVSRDLVPKPGGCAGTYDCSALANFVCCQNLKVASAAGWTSLWMWLVYGFLVMGITLFLNVKVSFNCYDKLTGTWVVRPA